MSAAGADNTNANPNIIFTIKDTKLCVPVVTLSARQNKKLSKLLSKRFETLDYWNEYKTKSENKNTIGMNIKQKVRIKTWQMNIDIFSHKTLLELIGYLF